MEQVDGTIARISLELARLTSGKAPPSSFCSGFLSIDHEKMLHFASSKGKGDTLMTRTRRNPDSPARTPLTKGDTRCDAEHPTVITMSRVRSASDTCDLYFTYTKVNLLLYTCSLDPFEDGILLDTPPVCMHRYCRNFTDDKEECKRQGTPTPPAREAWKRT